MPEIVTTRVLYPDSLDVGSPSKGGNLHVFFDADDLSGTQKRIDNAVKAREYLLNRLAQGGSIV